MACRALISLSHSPDAVKSRTLAKWLNEELLTSPLFAEAVTHRSAGGINNERLEYLGDAVLGLIIAEHLFCTHVDAREGDLSRMRAHLVRKKTLARIAKELHLSARIVLGSGELKSGGDRRDTILADTLEAIFGAVYLIKGMEYTKSFVLDLFQAEIAALPPSHELRDPKTRLQEYLQSRNLPLPAYGLHATSGEPHAQHFTIYCRVESAGLQTLGDGNSKREAEQAAAAKALIALLEEHASR